MYNLGKNDSSKWRRIGEEPVIYDSIMTERTKQQFNLFLDMKGFFNAQVTDSVKFFPKRKNAKKTKVKVTYYIRYNEPYKIRTLYYATQDTGISPMINYFQQSSLLIPGDRYDEEIIEKERERITNDLKDKGYYFFNRNYITFQIDTSLGTHQADIYMYINRINENVGLSPLTDPITDHHPYTIRNIYVHTDYNPRDPMLSVARDTAIYNGYYILSTGHQRAIRDNVLLRSIVVKPGDRYLPGDISVTYKRLQDLEIYKFINFTFKEVTRESDTSHYQLDLIIQLSPAAMQDYTIESELTNTGSNIGVAGSFAYRNKNIFRGAEVLELKLKGGLEAIPNFNSTEEKKIFYLFNTYELGPEASFGLKRLLWPKFIDRYTTRWTNQKTNIVLGFNHQDRPDFNRSITNFSLSFSFNPPGKTRWVLYLPDINAVQVTLSDEFKSKLENLEDPRLLYAYDTHIITAARVSMLFSNQKVNTIKDFIMFRITPEVAVKAFSNNQNPSQYLKGEFDGSYNHFVDPYNVLVWRLAFGYGLPYGDSRALPFEKSFFSGGANSIRAWNTRTLGPGSFRKTLNIEQSGDIKLETNFEYRSELVRFANGIILEAAAFIDAGNIWTRNEDISRPGSKFELAKVIPEFGIGGGTGLRFNFSFFILRFDAAVKLRDPSLEAARRWVYPNQKFVIGDVVLNLAIGYPF